MAKLFKLPRRNLKLYNSVKEVPNHLVKLSEGRSKYCGKANQAALPTALVANSAVRLYYSPSESYWEKPSDFDSIPWLSGEATEVETNQGKVPLDQAIRFKSSRSKDSAIDLEYHATHLPKPDALPLCFLGWAGSGYYSKSQEIQPQFIAFAKEDCLPVSQSSNYSQIQKISLFPPNGITELTDPRFVLISARNGSTGFAITGTLTNAEWESYSRRAIPGAPEPCPFTHVVMEQHSPGVVIPLHLHGKVHPEWFIEVKDPGKPVRTEFMISYDTALQLIPTFGNDLATPARWVTKIQTSTRSRINSPNLISSVSVEMASLINSTLIVSEAVWSSDSIHFDLAQISSWPRQPLSAHIAGTAGVICVNEPDPQNWKVVNKDHSDIPFVYPHPGKRGYRKVHVVDLKNEQAKQQRTQAVEAQLGRGFQSKYLKFLGPFNPKTADQYLKAALYIRDHEVCIFPDYLGNVKKVFTNYNFCDSEEGLKALRKVKPSTDYRGLQKTLVYLWFKVDKVLKEEIVTLLQESEPHLADMLSEHAAKADFKPQIKKT